MTPKIDLKSKKLLETNPKNFQKEEFLNSCDLSNSSIERSLKVFQPISKSPNNKLLQRKVYNNSLNIQILLR